MSKVFTSSHGLTENPLGKFANDVPAEAKSTPKYEMKIVWPNVLVYTICHYILLRNFGFWLFQASWTLHLYVWLLVCLGTIGVTGGSHRLWSHRAYKANAPYRFLIMLMATLANQDYIYDWVRNHRVHHKFTDTDADPHNSKRGFFFCHVGWLLVRKHPDVVRECRAVDMSDIHNDWIVMWQKKYYHILMPLVTFVIPSLIPVYLWGEDPWLSFQLCGVSRWLAGLHGAWFVNSAAHMWGTRPYDSSITAVQNVWVTFFTLGEGWHNFHHAFPGDYKSAEHPYLLNVTTCFIDFFSLFGWTYDFKTVNQAMITKTAMRVGDGTYPSINGKIDSKTDIDLDNNRSGNDASDEQRANAGIAAH